MYLFKALNLKLIASEEIQYYGHLSEIIHS